MTIEQALKLLPKPGIPAELAAAIEQETIFKKKRWNSDGFRLRWLPALVGLATALGVLWLSKIQKHPDPRAILPIVSVPLPHKETLHAALPKQNEEMFNSEKGERREPSKS